MLEPVPARPRPLLLALALAGTALGVYANAIPSGFVWDDVPIVVEGTIARGTGALADIVLAPDAVKPYYRPVNRASYVLDAAVWGSRPSGFHAVNVGLQVANVLALFFLALLLFRNPWLAFGAALLLAVHPINTETVDFVSARNNLLALLFLQGALGLLALGLARPSPAAIWGSAACWFLALGSKESAAAGVLLLVAYAVRPVLPSGPSLPRRLASLLPHALALAGYLALRRAALEGGPGTGLHLRDVVEMARLNYHVIPRYLGLVLYPVRLNVFHEVPAGGVSAAPWLILAWLGIAAATAAILLQRSLPSLLGAAWLLVNFLPVANLVPIPSATMAERFLYLPAVGLWVIAADQAVRLRERVPWKRALLLLYALLVGALAGVTVRRNLDWRDDLSLFRSSVEKDPRSSLGLFNMGSTLRDQGDLEGARRAWEKAIEVNPRDVGPLVQLGTLAAIQGDLPRAERLYRSALDVDPSNATANLDLARVCERTGRDAEAILLYGRFLELATSEEQEHVASARASRDRLLRSMGGHR